MSFEKSTIKFYLTDRESSLLLDARDKRIEVLESNVDKDITLDVKDWGICDIKGKLNIVNKYEVDKLNKLYLNEVYTILCNILESTPENKIVPQVLVDIINSDDTEMEFLPDISSICSTVKITTDLGNSSLTDLQIDLITNIKLSSQSSAEYTTLHLFMLESNSGAYSYILANNSCIHLLAGTQPNNAYANNLICIIDSVGVIIPNKHIYAEKSLIRPSVDTMTQILKRAVIRSQSEMYLSVEDTKIEQDRYVGEFLSGGMMHSEPLPYDKVSISVDDIFKKFELYNDYNNISYPTETEHLKVVNDLKKAITEVKSELCQFIATTDTDLYKTGDFICLGTRDSKLLIIQSIDCKISEFLILSSSIYESNRIGTGKSGNIGIKLLINSEVYNLTDSKVDNLVIRDSIVLRSTLIGVTLVENSTILYSLIGTLYQEDISIENCVIRNSNISAIDISTLDYAESDTDIIPTTTDVRKLTDVVICEYNKLLKGDRICGVPGYRIYKGGTILLDVCEGDVYEEEIPESMVVSFDSGYIIMIRSYDSNKEVIKKLIFKAVLGLCSKQ